MKFVLLAHTDVSQSAVYRGMPQFPGRIVEFLGDRAPLSLWTAGSIELVCVVDSGQSRSVALAASVESPASVADATFHLVQELADVGAVFVGGFHSPLERLCLSQLAAAGFPAIVCLGRTLAGLRIPHTWLGPLREGKLVLVSACGPSQKRATRDSVRVRNDCVVALADRFVIPHATVGGKTEALCREVLKAGRAVWTLNRPGNQNLVALGAKVATVGKVAEVLNSGRKGLAASSQLAD
jgi:predicted Rossmann fold nucleotide-binding protein DprA/Smf involved in DNA uptake